ncbi:hypothetical protein TIFTF001_003798 [Ficus carica]|uniref:Uncharacterized protein n=1 Tax=Ficus carica TaxID=3494 RepID=A0AA87ZGD5_FICCA|nr:hypothetical protein TIFTF001_003798 [Ficus carica]
MASEGDWWFGDFGRDEVGGLGVSRLDLARQACSGLGSDKALVIRWLVQRSLTSNLAY